MRRLPYIDNAKAILIVLVVFGHVVELELAKSQPGATVFLFIYLFHIPAFVAVSGYLSRPGSLTGGGERQVFRLLIAYALFQTLMVVVMWSSIPHSFTYLLLHPLYTTWWLLSLVWWRLLLPLFAAGTSAIAAWLSVSAALGLALLVGTLPIDGGLLSISRTFVFLPFFVAGYRASQQRWHLPKGRISLAAALACMMATLAVLYWRFDVGLWPWLLGAYAQDGVAPSRAVFVRLVLTLWSSVLVLAFLRIVTSKRVPVTRLGSTTLSVFLWHGLAVQALITAGLAPATAGTWLAAFVTSATMVLLFGMGPMPELTDRMLEQPAGLLRLNGRSFRE